MSLAYACGGGGFGTQTQTAATAITYCLGGLVGKYTYVTSFTYTNLGTAHTATLMVGASRTTLSAAAAAAQAVINVTAALTDGGGNAIASGDYVAVQQNDGSWHLSTFSSAATLAYTLGTNLAVAAAAGNKVVCFGVIGDAYHNNADFPLTASTTVTYPAVESAGPLMRGSAAGDPIVFYDGNATAAGVLNYINWEYSRS